MGWVHAVVGPHPGSHQVLGFGIEHFLLFGIECCIKGFGGLVALAHGLSALLVQRLQSVQALGGAEPGQFGSVWPGGWGGRWFDSAGEGRPGGFLISPQLEPGLEFGTVAFEPGESASRVGPMVA